MDMERDALMLSGFGANEILKVKCGNPSCCLDLGVVCVLGLGMVE